MKLNKETKRLCKVLLSASVVMLSFTIFYASIYVGILVSTNLGKW